MPKKSNKKLPTHQAAYNELTKSLTHKIRNQLTILLTSAELASKRLENKGEVKKFVDLVKENVLRLIAITETMLKHGRRNKE